MSIEADAAGRQADEGRSDDAPRERKWAMPEIVAENGEIFLLFNTGRRIDATSLFVAEQIHEEIHEAYATGAAQRQKEISFRSADGIHWVRVDFNIYTEARRPLERKLAALTAADEGDGITAAFLKLMDEHQELLASRRPLAEALRKYGIHRNCDSFLSFTTPCSCGLDAALRAVEGGER